MNEEYLQNLYGWIGSNDISFTKDVGFEQFKTKMQNPEYVQKMHGWISSIDQNFGKDLPLAAFNNRIKGGASLVQPQTEVKKKEDTTVLPSGLGSSASSESADNLSSLAVEVQDKSILTKQPRGAEIGESRMLAASESTRVPNLRIPQKEQQPDEIDKKLEQIEKQKLEQIEQERLAFLNNPTPNTEADYFQGTFGNMLRTFDNYSPIGLGDIADDIARAVASGYRSGDLAQASNKIIRSGNEFTDEDIQNLINKQAEFEALGPSKEYQDYYKTYVLEGKTVWGAVKGLMENPTVFPEVAISSLVSMATNREAALAAGGALAAAFGLGAATGGTAGTFVVPGIGTAVGSTAAGLTAAASSVPFAFGAASTVIETGSVFAQGLQEQLGTDENGNPIKPTKENVRAILEDPEKYDKIKNDAILRGFTVGIIDAVGGKLATGVGANILRKSAAATGNITKTGLVKSLAAGGVIEGAAGGTGEALGQVVIGKPIDTGNVVLEIAAEMPGALRSTLMASLKVPTYKINKGKVSAEEIDRAISTMTPEQLAAADIEIYNDFDGRKKLMQDKIVTGSIAAEVRAVQPDLNEPTVNAIVELQKELNKLEGNKTQVAKDKAAQIRADIKNLRENQLPDQATVEPTVFTEADRARKKELEDAIEGATSQNIQIGENLTNELQALNKKEQDAIQEQAAGQVPVQPTAGVSQEVEQGVPQAESQVVTEAGIQEEVAPQEEVFTLEEEAPVQPVVEEAAAQAEPKQRTVSSRTQKKIDKVNQARRKEFDEFQGSLDQPYFIGNDTGPTVEQFINNKYDEQVNELMAAEPAKPNARAKAKATPAPATTVETIAEPQAQPAPKPTAQAEAEPNAAATEQPTAEPIIIQDVQEDMNVNFAPENAVEIEKGTKYDSRERRNLFYNAAVTSQATDRNGTPIGTITKRANEDGTLSFTVKNSKGQNVNKGKAYNTERDARTALAEQVNKQIQRESVKQKAKQASVEVEQVINLEQTSPELAERALAVFENIDKSLGNKLKRNANDALLAIPLTTLQAAVKAVKVLIKGGIAVRDAIRRVAAENKIDENKLREAFVALTKPVVSDLETEGVGVKLTGEEEVISGENNPTVKTINGYQEDYSADDIFSETHAPNSRVVTTASNIASGKISYTKDGEKITFQLPYLNANLDKRIKSLREQYKAITSTSKAAKAEKEALKKEINKVAKKVLSDFTDVMSQNLLALYDTLTPEFVKNSKEWYVGANRMANAISDKYDMTVEQVSGIIAALSPQNDWFNNVSVAERTIEIMTKYADTKLTQDIVDRAVKYNSDKKGVPNEFAKIIIDLFNNIGEVSINEAQNKNDGTFIQSTILRAFDQAINSPKVAITDPTGAFVGFDTTPVRWNSTSEISKAINIFRNGDVKNVNENLGNGNKVRNFYNNIVDPNSKTPYVTADTHALSAALNSPISANDAGGFGLFNGSLEPSYALVKEAYIRAAEIAGVLPREMQSITWEAQRIGINDKNRTEAKKQELFDYISESRKNKETAYERATELIARNKSADPTWGKADGIRTQITSDQIRSEARVRAEQRSSALSSLRGRPEGRVGAADTAVGREAAGRKSFDEVADLDVKSKDNLAVVSDFLDSIDRSISKRLRTNANDALLAIPLTAVQGMVKGLKVLVQGGMAVRDAIKKIAADNNISQDNLKDLLNLIPIQEEFNKVMARADALITRQKSKSIADERILTNLETKLRKEPAYINATDAQRKIMEREARAKMGVKPRKAASIGRVIGALKDITNVTREEKLKIIGRIRELGKDVGKELAKEIRAMKINGQITTAQATNIISRLTQVNPLNETSVSNFVDYMAEVFAKVKEKNRQTLLKDLVKLVSEKAKTAKTESGKRRSKGLDDIGQAFFDAIKPIIKAAATNDINALEQIKKSIDNNLIESLIIKTINGGQLDTRERVLLDQSLAYDTFADLATMNIEQIQELYNQLKDARTESIARLKSKRLERAQEVNALHEEVNEQIKKGFGILYNEDGTLKGDEQLGNEVNAIWESFNNLKIWDAVLKTFERYDFSIASKMFDYIRKNLSHIGTISDILDKKGKFFTKNIYDAINEMDSNHLEGYYNQLEILDEMANKIDGITKGFKEFKSKMSNKVIGIDNIIATKTGSKYRAILSQDQAMRIYALFKNPIQKEKLINQGFNEANIKKIEEFIGPEGMQMADMMVEYFSGKYYESVNNVYRKVNDVSLGYVESYFPTKTITTVDSKLLTDGNFSGIFDAETAPALKERTDKKGDVDLMASFTDVVDNHIQTMERYKAYAEGVKRINSIFNSPAVQALLGKFGTDLNRVYKNLINFAVNPNGGTTIEQTVLDRVMNSFAGFALGYKLIQIPKQATSFITAFEDYNYRGEGKKRIPGLDTMMFMVDTAKTIVTLPTQVRKALEISASFKDRLNKGLEGDVYGLESGALAFKPISKRNTLFGRIVRAFKKGAAFPTVMGDILGVMGYMINYNRNIANGMSESDALKAFNNYNATQQSRRAADKIPLQQSQNALSRAFTMFGSTTFLQMNKVIQGINNIMKSLGEKKTPNAKDMRAVAINIGLANAFFVLASNMAMLIDGDDEDRDRVLQLMLEALLGLNLVYQIPLIGGAVEVAVKKAKGDKSPSSDVINPYITVYNKIAKGAKEDDLLKAGQPIIEMVLGTQVDQFVGLYNIMGGDFDDNNIYDLVGISKSYRPGYGSSKSEAKSSEKKGMTKAEMKKQMPKMYKEIYSESDAILKEIRNEKKKMLKDAGIEYDDELDLE